MSGEVHNELLTEGVEPELQPEIEIEEPTGTGPEVSTEPEPPEHTGTPAEPTGTDTHPPASEVDEEPMTTAQMREHMKKLEAQVNSMHRRLSRQPRAQHQPVSLPEPIDESKAPKIEDFDTVEDFEAAKTNWDINRRVADEVRKAIMGNPEENIRAQRQEFVTDTVNNGKTLYQDFESVVLSPTVPITNEIIDAVREVDNEKVSPEDILYYLGKNPTEAAAVSRMSPTQVVRAITRIETKLEGAKANAPAQAPKKTVTGAPPPIKPTDSTVVIHKDPEKMTQAEYEAWRLGQSKKG